MRRWTTLPAGLILVASVSVGQESGTPAPTADETEQARQSGGDRPGVDPLQRLYRHNRRGNRAFTEGDLEGAQREYVEAQGLAPSDPRVLYNLGNTLAGQGSVEDALSTLERAAEGTDDRTLERDARFNSGILQMGRQDLEGAVRSFGRALTLDPADQEARRNLELALRQLQQQQQEQQQQGQQGDQGEQDQQQDQEEQQQDRDQEQEQQEQDRDQEQQDEQQQQQQPGDQQRDGQQQQQDEQERDAQREAAQRLLKALEDEEKEALKKALQQKLPDAPDRKEDW